MKRLFVTVITLTLLFSCLAASGCGDKKEENSEAIGIVAKFMEASMSEDADAVWELLTKSDQEKVTDRKTLVEGASEVIESWTVGAETTENGKTKVAVTFTNPEASQTITFNVVLVKEGGKLKVSMGETEASLTEAVQRLMDPQEDV